jgi:protein-S-isoprenylcysteine O-methyltransferase Ste14
MAWDSIGSLPSVSVRTMNFSSSSWKSNQTENGNAHVSAFVLNLFFLFIFHHLFSLALRKQQIVIIVSIYMFLYL